MSDWDELTAEEQRAALDRAARVDAALCEVDSQRTPLTEQPLRQLAWTLLQLDSWQLMAPLTDEQRGHLLRVLRQTPTWRTLKGER